MHKFYPQDHNGVQTPEEPVVSKAEVNKLFDVIFRSVAGHGQTNIMLGDIRVGVTRWSRNRVRSGIDQRRRLVRIDRILPGFSGYTVLSNQIDPPSLVEAIRYADGVCRTLAREPHGNPYIIADEFSSQPLSVPPVTIWSDVTANTDARARVALAATVLGRTASENVQSAGSVAMKTVGWAVYDQQYSPRYGTEYVRYTHADVAASVRHPSGRGSGWVGISTYDWGRIDSAAMADAALDRAIRSVNPVRVEPGRYTVILEPQAVGALILQLVTNFSRRDAESERGPYSIGRDNRIGKVVTKLGLRIVDERVTLYHDPAEPGLGVLPKLGMKPITWIERGVLKTLETGHMIREREMYELKERNRSIPAYGRMGFKMAGGGTSLEEMVRTTKRGLYISRFSDLIQIDEQSLLYTGLTRDGVWLIEDGEMKKSVSNLRFIESPLFVLNNLDQIGEPVSIHFDQIRGSTTYYQLAELAIGPMVAMVPPIKARDFNLVAMVEAV